jgi:hypothetical protein
MKNPTQHKPPGTIFYSELIDLIIEQGYGSGAAENPNVRDLANDAVIQACYSRELFALAINEKLEVEEVPGDYWDAEMYLGDPTDEKGVRIYKADRSRWIILTTGKYKDHPICFPKEEANKLLEALGGKTVVRKKEIDRLTFYRVKKTWRIGFSDIKNIDSVKGMAYYQHLFLNPNKFYSALDLQILGNKQDINFLNKTKFLDNDSKYTAPQNEPEIDSISIRKELEERYDAFQKSEGDGSLDVDILEGQYEDLKKIYTSLYDLYGKPRDASQPEEKARKAVSKTLKTAREKILEYLPELEDLFKDVKTGNSFGYTPSKPDKPVGIVIDKQE